MIKKHKPTLLDASSDFLRCVYLSEKGFENKDFIHFYNLAKNTYNLNNSSLSKSRINTISKQLKKAVDESLSVEKRREHILTASVLLL